MAVPTPQMRAAFPNLTVYAETSVSDARYNCHAYAADVNTCWWDPSAVMYAPFFPWKKLYWPPSVPPNDYTLDNFRRAHNTVGFQICADAMNERGFEKIAHFAVGNRVTHTARQLPWGTWTSKLGEDIDIEHLDPYELEGPAYGDVVGFMRRPQQAQLVLTTGSQLVSP